MGRPRSSSTGDLAAFSGLGASNSPTYKRQWKLGQGMTDGEFTPPTNRMVVAVLSLIGVFLAFYLLAHNLGWIPPLPCGIGDCHTVQNSKWAYVGPIPVSGVGLGGYVSLLVLALIGLQPGASRSVWIPRLLLMGSGIGVAFSAWLTYLEAAVINAWCQYCVASAILILLIFFACLPERRRLSELKLQG